MSIEEICSMDDVCEGCTVTCVGGVEYFTKGKEYEVILSSEDLSIIDDYGDVETLYGHHMMSFFKVTGVPSPEYKKVRKLLDEGIAELEASISELKAYAKEKGVSFDLVLLEDAANLNEWYSSCC
jgi:hypothetical protein